MKVILTSKGQQILCDDEDYEELSETRWYVEASGHCRTEKRGKKLLMHRVVMGCSPGDGKLVDHINGNTLDNRKCNLRLADHRRNQQNRKILSSNTTGYKGVEALGKGRNYRARIWLKGKAVNLGRYPTAEEAHEVYCLWADMIYGEFANYGDYQR